MFKRILIGKLESEFDQKKSEPPLKLYLGRLIGNAVWDIPEGRKSIRSLLQQFTWEIGPSKGTLQKTHRQDVGNRLNLWAKEGRH